MRVSKGLSKSALICLSAIILLFSGCSEKSIQISTVQSERMKLNLPEPEQLKLKPVTFYVLTEKNKDAVFKQLETQNKDKVLIGLSDDDYQKMSENLIHIQNYIIQQRQIIKSYKEYYELNKEENIEKN